VGRIEFSILKDHPFFEGALLKKLRRRQKLFFIFVAVEYGVISKSSIDKNG